MKLSSRSDWESKITDKAKVYPVGINDRDIMNKTFDALHDQGKLEWIKDSTSFSFLIFVV